MRDQLCPKCGEFFARLNGRTGWCAKCTGTVPKENTCSSCGKEHSSTGRLCGDCYRKEWSERNAIAVEYYVRSGLTLVQARRQVSKDNWPICISCGKPIKRGRPGSLICRTTERCKKARYRYKYLTQSKGLTRREAIQQIREAA